MYIKSFYLCSKIFREYLVLQRKYEMYTLKVSLYLLPKPNKRGSGWGRGRGKMRGSEGEVKGKGQREVLNE